MPIHLNYCLPAMLATLQILHDHMHLAWRLCRQATSLACQKVLWDGATQRPQSLPAGEQRVWLRGTRVTGSGDRGRSSPAELSYKRNTVKETTSVEQLCQARAPEAFSAGEGSPWLSSSGALPPRCCVDACPAECTGKALCS